MNPIAFILIGVVVVVASVVAVIFLLAGTVLALMIVLIGLKAVFHVTRTDFPGLSGKQIRQLMILLTGVGLIWAIGFAAAGIFGFLDPAWSFPMIPHWARFIAVVDAASALTYVWGVNWNYYFFEEQAEKIFGV